MQTKINNTLTSGSSAKLRDFAKKFERPAPPEDSTTVTPAPRDDIFERMDLANKLEHDNSIDAVIDVTPDVRYPFAYIVFNVMKLYKTVTDERPLLTPASFVAYCLFQLYAFMLINDSFGRPAVSFPANAFHNDDSRESLFEILTKSYVPPFMLTLFHALADCSDPRRPGLQYFCTLAGSRFNIDFGRLLPPQIFLHMHNCSTDADTSRNVPAAMTALLNQVIFNTQHATRPIRTGNYFSAGTANATYYASWMYEALRTLFSPVTGKSLLRRTNIQPVNIVVPTIHTFPGQHDVRDAQNMYVIMLNADRQNARSTLRFISAMSNIVKNDLKGVFQLGAVPDDLNGVNILVHGYSAFALPTWQDLKFDAAGDYTTSMTADEYSTALSYKVRPAHTRASTHVYPDLAADKLDTFIEGLYLQRNQAYDPVTNMHDREIEFDEERDVAPRVVFLDPYTSGDGPINYSMLAGLIIESEELDGSSVPLPNPLTGLSKINRDFLQGAIRLTNVAHAYHETNRIPYTPLPRTILRGMQQKISHDLYSIEVNRLGILTTGSTDATFPTRPQGFTITRYVRDALHMFNKWSFSTAENTTPTPTRCVVWSPYRYVLSDEDAHPAEASTYMLVNHRTLYGTHIPLVASRHPSTIIPIS